MAKQVNTKAEIRGYLIVMLMLIYLVVIKILKRDKNKGVKKQLAFAEVNHRYNSVSGWRFVSQEQED